MHDHDHYHHGRDTPYGTHLYIYRLANKGTIANNPQVVGIIIVPTLIFAAVLSTFTKAQRYELLAASAG
jgi:hypothetical protein